MINSQEKIKIICKYLSDFLIEKNKRYGNSALDPLRIFSDMDTSEQILVRIDDKLSRIKNLKLSDIRMPDTILDLMGYLVLLTINQNWEQKFTEGLKDN